jgi:ubiquinone/menaquinone biosynthesis C-methylase UbiE
MARFLTPRRRDDPELMDAPGLPPEEVAHAYKALRQVNRQLGNLGTLRRELRHFLDQDVGGAPVRVLDVGSGSGDLPRSLLEWLRHRGIEGRAVALDLGWIALGLAARNGLATVRADALRLPFSDRSFDLVTAIKFAHHFRGPELMRLLAELTRVAKHRVMILDIRRHWLAYWGFVAWSRVFTSNRLVRHDGPLSVLRGFTADELDELTSSLVDFTWTIRSYPGFQLAAIGRRHSPDPS